MPEIRLRDVKPELLKKLEAICKHYGKATATGCIEKLIMDFEYTQSHLEQLRQRNTDLHRRLAQYVDREDLQRETVQDLLRSLKDTQKEVERNLKRFAKQPAQKKKR